MSNIISFDESGNTGNDLLNKDQENFVLSSNNFNNEELEELISIFELDKELHFKQLKKSEEGRKKVIQLLNHDLITEEKTKSVIAEKEIILLGHIIDQLFETVANKKNRDIYKNGDNIYLTNYLYFYGNNIWNKVLYQTFLTSFVAMFRLKTEDSIEEFYESVYQLCITEKKGKEILIWIISSKIYAESILERVDKFTLDITYSALLVLSSSWHDEVNQNIDVIFDNSKQITHYIDEINYLREMDIPSQKVGFNSRKMTYPLPIDSLSLVDSKNHKAVQISDLIASAIGFYFNNKNEKQKKFVNEIGESKLLNLENFFTLLPLTPSELTPEALGLSNPEGINVLDFLADYRIKKNTPPF